MNEDAVENILSNWEEEAKQMKLNSCKKEDSKT
jgi:hypothetical protein